MSRTSRLGSKLCPPHCGFCDNLIGPNSESETRNPPPPTFPLDHRAAVSSLIFISFFQVQALQHGPLPPRGATSCCHGAVVSALKTRGAQPRTACCDLIYCRHPSAATQTSNEEPLRAVGPIRKCYLGAKEAVTLSAHTWRRF